RSRAAFHARQIAAHRHAVAIAKARKVSPVDVAGGEIPAAEEAQADATASGGIDLSPLDRVIDRLARVLRRPHRRQSRSAKFPVLLHAARYAVLEAIGPRFRTEEL